MDLIDLVRTDLLKDLNYFGSFYILLLIIDTVSIF